MLGGYGKYSEHGPWGLGRSNEKLGLICLNENNKEIIFLEVMLERCNTKSSRRSKQIVKRSSEML
jgi:hypothetical protein